jgi:nitronate monooxygenase
MKIYDEKGGRFLRALRLSPPNSLGTDGRRFAAVAIDRGGQRRRVGSMWRPSDASGRHYVVGQGDAGRSRWTLSAQSLGARSVTSSRPAHEARVCEFLAGRGPRVAAEAGDALPPDFNAQCEAFLDAAPPIVSSVMELYPPQFIARLKAKGIAWFANISTVAEALAAEAAGAEVVVAQGMEAGGHRGYFDAAKAEAEMVGLFALIPAVVDAVRIPVVATGGIADARGIAAALSLGASAAQIGTGYLRCPEAQIVPAWADAIGRTLPRTNDGKSYFQRQGGTEHPDRLRARGNPPRKP